MIGSEQSNVRQNHSLSHYINNDTHHQYRMYCMWSDCIVCIHIIVCFSNDQVFFPSLAWNIHSEKRLNIWVKTQKRINYTQSTTLVLQHVTFHRLLFLRLLYYTFLYVYFYFFYASYLAFDSKQTEWWLHCCYSVVGGVCNFQYVYGENSMWLVSENSNRMTAGKSNSVQANRSKIRSENSQYIYREIVYRKTCTVWHNCFKYRNDKLILNTLVECAPFNRIINNEILNFFFFWHAVLFKLFVDVSL